MRLILTSIIVHVGVVKRTYGSEEGHGSGRVHGGWGLVAATPRGVPWSDPGSTRHVWRISYVH